MAHGIGAALRASAATGGTVLIFAAENSPEGLESNISAWLKAFGVVHPPDWIAGAGADKTAALFGCLLLGIAAAPTIWAMASSALGQVRRRLAVSRPSSGNVPTSDASSGSEPSRNIDQPKAHELTQESKTDNADNSIKEKIAAFVKYHLARCRELQMDVSRDLFFAIVARVEDRSLGPILEQKLLPEFQGQPSLLLEACASGRVKEGISLSRLEEMISEEKQYYQKRTLLIESYLANVGFKVRPYFQAEMAWRLAHEEMREAWVELTCDPALARIRLPIGQESMAWGDATRGDMSPPQG